jgi:ABC-type molybdate transport system substrate-binding protein
VVAVYPTAVLSDTINQPLADAFLAYLLGPQGQAALQQSGFVSP